VFQLSDNITVTITFIAGQSWRANWVKNMSMEDQNRLLKHEQGHYNLGALIGRDFFLELMQLKLLTFSGLAEFQREQMRLKSALIDKIRPIQVKYDSDTIHGTVQAQQNKWDNLINTAFTVPRNPPATAADGVPLKRPLLDVLREANVNL
jgi:hypothetical protein